MKTFRHWDADYTPNDMGETVRATEETRTPKEVGDSELETIAEWSRIKEEDVKNDYV